MAELSVLVVDDEPEGARALTDALGPALEEAGEHGACVKTCSSVEDLMRQIADGGAPDLLFIDVCLKGARGAEHPVGIDVAERLSVDHPATQVVFVSGFDAYHTAVYRAPHACYLKKPFTNMQVSEALGIALGARRTALEQPLVLRIAGTDHVVAPSHIIYLESKLRMVTLHTRQGSLETYGKLDDFAALLPSRFVRTHQSFLVNLDAVRRLTAEGMVLDGGTVVPVSRRHRQQVREALFARVREAQ